MKVLVDTQVALWSTREPEKLSAVARALLQAGNIDLLLSDAPCGRSPLESQSENSIWECHFMDFVDRLHEFGFGILSITLLHIEAQIYLPNLHGDPFDRRIICQAQVERLPLLTADSRLRDYAVETIR